MNKNYIAVVDFETRSKCDLTTAGDYLYAQHPSTEVICLSVLVMHLKDPTGLSDQLYTWVPLHPDESRNAPDWLCDLVKWIVDNDVPVCAFNARFDFLIWKYVAHPRNLLPNLELQRWMCAAAQCRVNGIPGALDKACRALKLKHQKNKMGEALIRKYCIPNKNGNFNVFPPSDMDAMAEYCEDDVIATAEVLRNTRPLNQTERRDWYTNERINNHGIRIDREFAEAATRLADIETAAIGKELAELTGGKVTKHTQNQRIKTILLERLPEQVTDLMIVFDKGKKKYSLAKDIRETILSMADEGALEIDDISYNLLACLDEASASSVSKYKSMADRAHPNDLRVRGAFLYAGAGTLRYSSRGLQLHNMRRDCYDEYEAHATRAMIVDGIRPDELTVMQTLAKMLRPTLVPAPGNVLVVGDWKAIENRTLPWLSKDDRANDKLQLFRDGGDPYIKAAADVGIDDRQVGKVIELSMGFGGAVGAFNAMARNYGVFLPEHTVRGFVDRWRAANPWAPYFWYRLETAAKDAIRHPGASFDAGRVEYTFVDDLMGGTLLCELPGGTMLSYPSARIDIIDGPAGSQPTITALKGNWTPRADAKEWPRFKLWGGLLAENVTQAFAAFLLREALNWFVERDWKVALHCHDEMAVECFQEQGERVQSLMKKVMQAVPKCAKGLPLQCDPVIMNRYGKG